MRVLLALFATLLLLSVGSGATAGSSTPPRNGLIAVLGVDGLHVVDPRSGTDKLVPGSQDMTDAVWSPDGMSLAVSTWRDEDFGVFTVKPDGTSRQLVLLDARSPSWSPDGNRLVVVQEAGSRNHLVIVSANGTVERVLEPDGLIAQTYVSSPAWSPDGSQIAFVAGEDRVYLMTPDGEKLRAIDVEGAGHVSWSPDSSLLAIDRYIESKNGGRHVVVLHDLSTGKETLLTGEQDGAQSATWSPEGDQMAFLSMSKASTSTTTTAHCGAGEPFVSHLWVMAPDGTKAHKVVEGEFYGTPSWGRAAETLSAPEPVSGQKPAPVTEQVPAPPLPAPTSAQTSKPVPASRPTPTPTKKTEPPAVAKGLIAVRASNGLYLVDPSSAEAHTLPGTADMTAPAWSPDARLLAVEKAEKGGATSIYTIWPNGTHPQLVLPDASSPSWSAAGDRIFATRNECSTPCEPEDDDANVLYAVNLDGSNVQRVDFEDADVYESRELAWPTDGSAIHFFDEESLVGPGSCDSSAAVWSPDGAELVFTGSAGPTEEANAGKTGLWTVSADGGRPHLLLSGASGRPSWVASQAGREPFRPARVVE